MIKRLRSRSILMMSLLIVLMLITSVTTIAQSTQTPNVLQGTISTLYADPIPGSNNVYQAHILLFASDGTITRLSNLSLDQATSYEGQLVQVTGRALPATTQSGLGTSNNFHVNDIASIGGFTTQEFPISGTKTNLNLLCSFSDAGPIGGDLAGYFGALTSNSYPGTGHYFNTISYAEVTVNTDTIDTWFEMSGTGASYEPVFFSDLFNMAQECIDMADAAHNLSAYNGINLMFDGEFGGFGFGIPSAPLVLEGSQQNLRVTWLPPYGWLNQFFIAHEIGHTFNMRHTSGYPAHERYPYDNYWDVMSGGGEDNSNTTLSNGFSIGGIAPGTSAINMALAGWTGLNRTDVVDSGTQELIVLDSLIAPANGSSDVVGLVPINGSQQHYYTIEVHTQDNYNADHPYGQTSEGILIYRVDTAAEPIAILQDSDGDGNVSDAGALFQVGETFTDTTNNITIAVQSTNGTTFNVLVTNNKLPDQPTNFTISGDLLGNNPTFTWDHDDVSIWYYLQLNGPGDPITQWFEVGNDVTCNGTCSVNMNVPTGSYSAWVHGYNAAGNGPWSDPGNPDPFIVGPPPPPVPDGLNVTGDLINLPTQPTYIWNHDAGNTWYNLYVSGPGGMIANDWFEVNNGLTCNSTCEVDTVGTITQPGTYSMWVQAYNSAGNTWSDVYEFNAGPPPPVIPTGLDVLGDLTTLPAQPTYEWTYDPNATWYNFYVDGPSGTVTEWLEVGVDVNCNGGTCSISNLAPMTATGEHTFWLQGYNPTATSDWGGPDTFDAGPPPPAIPTGLNATGDLTSLPAQPVYVWNHDPNTTWYNFFVGGPSGTVTEWLEVGVDVNCNGGTCSISNLAPMTAAGKHTFWLQGYNPTATSDWGGPDAFDAGPPPPAIPSNIGVLDNSGGLPLQPVYGWAHDPNTTWYELYISGPSGLVYNGWLEVNNGLTCTAGACGINTVGELNAYGQYSVWVRGYNAAGMSDWSPTFNFDATPAP